MSANAGSSRTTRHALRWSVALAALVTALALAGPALSTHTTGTLGAPLHPDLQTLTPANFSVSQSGGNGRPSWAGGGDPEQRLLFDNEVMNLHTGPLEVVPTGDKCTTGQGAEGRVALQRIYHDDNGDGGFIRNQDNSSTERVAGCMTLHAQHRHWHFDDFSLFELKAKDGDGNYTVHVAESVKMTFCIADVNRRADLMSSGAEFSPDSDYYNQCSRNSAQGLSVGWGDLYPNGTSGQYIVVTNVGDGTYCFVSTADPLNKLEETDGSNNVASREITLATVDGKRQVTEGPSPCPS